MKIADIRDVTVAQKATTARPADAAAAVDKVSAQGVTSSVQLGYAAAGPSRARRIEQLTAAVKQGNYNPDPQRIADQILDDAQIDATLRALLK